VEPATPVLPPPPGLACLPPPLASSPACSAAIPPPPLQDPGDFTPAVLEDLVSQALGAPLTLTSNPQPLTLVYRSLGVALGPGGGARLPWTLHSAQPWRMNAAVAHRLSHGRIFFAGDSAHQFPPSGGFGLNTGLQVNTRGLTGNSQSASHLNGQLPPGCA
jgi:2-polyprenyl-6-methoxyphenol hydroxylase-like FAD-dependent oxidoreductase